MKRGSISEPERHSNQIKLECAVFWESLCFEEMTLLWKRAYTGEACGYMRT